MSDLIIVKVLFSVFLIIASNVEVYKASIVPCSYRLILIIVTSIKLRSSYIKFLKIRSYPFEASFIKSIIDKDSPFNV